MGALLECFLIYEELPKTSPNWVLRIYDQVKHLGRIEAKVVRHEDFLNPEPIDPAEFVPDEDTTHVWFSLHMYLHDLECKVNIALSLTHGNIEISVDENLIFMNGIGEERAKKRLDALYDVIKAIVHIKAPVYISTGSEYYTSDELVYSDVKEQQKTALYTDKDISEEGIQDFYNWYMDEYGMKRKVTTPADQQP